MTIPDINWWLIVNHLTHMLIAYGLALPIGWDSEREARGVGLRTFPLVAMACCGYILIGNEVLSGDAAQARILYGLMSGIGFIGGGAILKSEGSVSGTSTAAAIWSTGAIGAAVAWNRYEIALVLAVMTLFTLRVFRQVKPRPSSD